MAGLREAHLRDGVALVQFLCWVEKTVAGGGWWVCAWCPSGGIRIHPCRLLGPSSVLPGVELPPALPRSACPTARPCLTSWPALLSAGRVLNEVEIDEELTGRRAKQAGFVEPSFPTIAGTAGAGLAGWGRSV